MEFKDGCCVITKNYELGCLVLPSGSIYANREVLFSEEGILILSEMFENADEYFEGRCIINQKTYKRCIKVFNKIYLKRNAFVSRKGINNLINAMSERLNVTEPVITDQTESEVLEPVEPQMNESVDKNSDVEDVTEFEEEEISEVPGIDEVLQNLVKNREESQLKLSQVQQQFDEASDEDERANLKSLLSAVQRDLIKAEQAERDYINKD